MIQSKYKPTVELNLKAAKLAYKIKSKKKDLLINIFIPIALVLMIGVLIYDLNKNASIIFDVLLIVLLIVIEAVNLCMPIIISRSQKKYNVMLEGLNYDQYIVEYNNGVFKEKFYKDNNIVFANNVSADKLVGFEQFDHYIVLAFETFASITFDTDAMQSGTKQDLLLLCAQLLSLKKSKK